MQVKILAFAQAADRLGFRERVVECAPEDSPHAIIARFASGFTPANLRVAVDDEYSDWNQPIGEAREIALIPPVSGG